MKSNSLRRDRALQTQLALRKVQGPRKIEKVRGTLLSTSCLTPALFWQPPCGMVQANSQMRAVVPSKAAFNSSFDSHNTHDYVRS
eukprot:726741-Amphidinium_carterae.1